MCNSLTFRTATETTSNTPSYMDAEIFPDIDIFLVLLEVAVVLEERAREEQKSQEQNVADAV
jgi:hypothetical protein